MLSSEVTIIYPYPIYNHILNAELLTIENKIVLTVGKVIKSKKKWYDRYTKMITVRQFIDIQQNERYYLYRLNGDIDSQLNITLPIAQNLSHSQLETLLKQFEERYKETSLVKEGQQLMEIGNGFHQVQI